MKEFCILAGFAFSVMSSTVDTDRKQANIVDPLPTGTLADPPVFNALHRPAGTSVPDSNQRMMPEVFLPW